MVIFNRYHAVEWDSYYLNVSGLIVAELDRIVAQLDWRYVVLDWRFVAFDWIFVALG